MRGAAAELGATGVGGEYARLEVLDEENRVEEVARMLGGLKLTDNTLAHAREMLLDGGMAS